MISKYDYHKRELGENYYGAKPKKKNRLARSFVFLVFFLLIVALFVYVFPEVEVTIVPKTEKITNDFEVTIDGALDEAELEHNKLPGITVTADDALEKTFLTTGEKNVGEKAGGTVVLYNQTGLEQSLTMSNSLSSDTGQIFYLKNNVTIPKAEVSAEGTIVYGTVTAGIIAKEGGEAGNISAGRLALIDLPFSKQSKIYGEVKEKLTGGNNKTIKVVSEDDLKNAETKLAEELNPKLKEQLSSKLGVGQKMDDRMVKYQSLGIEKTVELQEEVGEFTVKLKGQAEALAWDEGKIKEILNSKLAESQKDGKQLVESSQDVFRVETKEVDLEKQIAKLTVHTENQISVPVDVEKLKDELKGMGETEARRFLLGRGDIKDVRFRFNYSITNKIPNNGNRITIKMGL
ncbi:MAG TPA: hypothetical protein P5267_00560 [Patescibacteria group bacterium]|nr:hypothetical protein [Patescibacteria group bacterium]